MFLVVANAHSKWPEVHELCVTTAAKTIEVFLPHILLGLRSVL